MQSRSAQAATSTDAAPAVTATVTELTDRWLEHAEPSLSPKTVHEYRRQLVLPLGAGGERRDVCRRVFAPGREPGIGGSGPASGMKSVPHGVPQTAADSSRPEGPLWTKSPGITDVSTASGLPWTSRD